MYAEKLLEIAHAINLKNESLKEDFEKDLNMCFQYTNTAAMSAIEIEMGNGDISEIARLNEKRNYMHNKLCEALADINEIAQSVNQQKPFDFNLEPMKKNGRFAGYSQDNHKITSEISSVIIDELNYLGRETYRSLDKLNKVEEYVYNQAKSHEFKLENYNSLMNSMEKYNAIHYDITELIRGQENMDISHIVLRDGSGELTIQKSDDYSVDVLEAKLSLNNELWEYIGLDETANDIPISVIRDVINNHEGYNKIMVPFQQDLNDTKMNEVLEIENKKGVIGLSKQQNGYYTIEYSNFCEHNPLSDKINIDGVATNISYQELSDYIQDGYTKNQIIEKSILENNKELEYTKANNIHVLEPILDCDTEKMDVPEKLEEDFDEWLENAKHETDLINASRGNSDIERETLEAVLE